MAKGPELPCPSSRVASRLFSQGEDEVEEGGQEGRSRAKVDSRRWERVEAGWEGPTDLGLRGKGPRWDGDPDFCLALCLCLWLSACLSARVLSVISVEFNPPWQPPPHASSDGRKPARGPGPRSWPGHMARKIRRGGACARDARTHRLSQPKFCRGRKLNPLRSFYSSSDLRFEL